MLKAVVSHKDCLRWQGEAVISRRSDQGSEIKCRLKQSWFEVGEAVRYNAG